MEVTKQLILEEEGDWAVNYTNSMKHAVREIASAGMRLIQPFALVWSSPTPAMAISKMPTEELQGPVEA